MQITDRIDHPGERRQQRRKYQAPRLVPHFTAAVRRAASNPDRLGHAFLSNWETLKLAVRPRLPASPASWSQFLADPVHPLPDRRGMEVHVRCRAEAIVIPKGLG